MKNKHDIEEKLSTIEILESSIYIEHYWRFINLAIFIYQHFLVGSGSSGINAIGPTLCLTYNLQESMIVFSNSTLLFFTIILGIFNSFYLEKLGIKKANILFSLFNIIGLSIRCFLYKNVLYLILGQSLCGIGNSFVVNAEMKFFKNWFDRKKIEFWFCFIGISVFFGSGFGSLIPFYWIDENEKDLTILNQQIQSSLHFHIYLMIFSLFFSLFLFKEKPISGFGYLIPPKSPKLCLKKFWRVFKYLFTNKLFVILSFLVGFGRGNIVCIFSLFNIFSKHVGYKESSGSLTLIAFIICGLLGSLFSNRILLENTQIKKKLILFSFLGILVLILSYLFFYTNQALLFQIFFGFSGFFLINQFPLAFSLIILKIKIDNLSLMNSIVIMLSQILGIINQTILIYFININDKGYNIFLFGLLLLYIIPLSISTFVKIN